jgi:hypothetical protein
VEQLMVRILVRVLAVAGLVLPGLSAAEQSSKQIKPGLWRISVGMPGGAGKTMRSQLCVDAQFKPSQMLERRPGAIKGNCNTINTERTADKVVRESECQSAGHTFHTVTTLTHTEVHMEETAVTEFDGRPTGTLRQTWDWVGSCPSGMVHGKLIATP